MTTVPGTYFTKEQLEAALKVDNVSGGGYSGSGRMDWIGDKYNHGKKQYERALAWYLLAARENHPNAQNNIGELYYFGLGVPKNYLCALKWYLKAAERDDCAYTPNNIGLLFENGYGVPLNKYKALQWYCHKGDRSHRNRLNKQGYHLSAADIGKFNSTIDSLYQYREIERPLEQLRKEAEVILGVEKKKLEQKQHKTQKEMETLMDVKITYKLVDGGKDAWKDVPILLATSKQRYTKPVNSSVTNNENEILELKKQIQLLKQERNTLISQTKELPPIKQEETKLQLQIKESNRQLTLLRNDFQLLHHKNVTFQQQIKANDSKITSLQRENQELNLKINSLDRQNMSFQTENQSLKQKIGENEKQLKAKDNRINSLENEQHGHHRTSIQQTQTLNSLKQEKQIMEQSRKDITNEMERIKSLNTTLEQLLKSKQDTNMSLNRENQMLLKANQGNQQGANEMVETLKSFLEAKTSETELLKQNMEHALDQEKRKRKKLQKDNIMLKQNQHQQTVNSRETRPSSNATVPETTASNTGINEDDPNNDFNYDTEYGTEYSSGDDTSSEDGDHTNDLSYDSDV